MNGGAPFDEIPGNANAASELRAALAGGNVIAFVGAGASAGLYPMWAQLIRRLGEAATAEGYATRAELERWLDASTTPAPLAAEEIKAAWGEGPVRTAIREIFAPPRQGPRFTPVHEALLRLGCRAYVTTNYDACLPAARRRVHPDDADAPDATWRDGDTLTRWIHRDIFDEVRYPILFAHGIYHRGETVVLASTEYKAAYEPGPYRYLIQRLWAEDRLLFVGFGFNDYTLEYVAREILERVESFKTAEPRHVAVLALRPGDDPVAMRRQFRDRFNARVLFYPVTVAADGNEDHGNLAALLAWLIDAIQAGTGTGTAEPGAWLVPHQPAATFVGRDALLATLERELLARGALAIHGPPGVGKTELAVQLAYRWRDSRRVRHVLWCRAENAEVLTADLAAAANELGAVAGADARGAAEAAERWLAEHEDWLLVLDNVEAPETVERLLPRGGRRHALVMTRSAAVAGTTAYPVAVEPLTTADAAALLVATAGRIGGAAAALDADERQASVDIADAMGGLPLAVAIAGRSIASAQSTSAQYRRTLEQIGTGGAAAEAPPAVAIRLAFQRLSETSGPATDLMRLCAFLAPDAIPEEVLDAAFPRRDGDPSSGIDASIAAAAQHDFIRRDATACTVSIHRMIPAVIRDAIGDDAAQRGWAARAVAAVAAVFPDPREPGHWPRCERLLSQAEACFQWIENFDLATAEAAELLNRLGYYLDERGLFERVEPVYRRALTIRKAVHGPRHPEVATSSNNLAWHYRARGLYDRAEPMYVEALDIRREALGDDAPETASSKNTLAMLFLDRGRFAEAEALLREALAVRTAAFGPEHPKTAAIENNLGWLLCEVGQYDKALPLLERALRVRTAQHPGGHPDTAATLNILGHLWRRKGDFPRAARYTDDGLAMRMHVLGPQHPETATSLNSLGEILIDQDKFEEAAGLFAAARAVLERAKWDRSPDMIWSLRGTALVEEHRGRPEEADRLFREALALAVACLGEGRYDVDHLREEYRQFRRRTGRPDNRTA